MLDTVKNCDVSTRAIQVLIKSVTRFVNTVRTKDLEDDYQCDQKIGIKPHLQPLDLQGQLISVDFYLIGC